MMKRRRGYALCGQQEKVRHLNASRGLQVNELESIKLYETFPESTLHGTSSLSVHLAEETQGSTFNY
jgi:hypothetical protein